MSVFDTTREKEILPVLTESSTTLETPYHTTLLESEKIREGSRLVSGGRLKPVIGRNPNYGVKNFLTKLELVQTVINTE